MNTVIGTVRNVACKNSNERFEIWINKNNDFNFPKEYTRRTGCPIKIEIDKNIYNVNLHRTVRNKYIWLSTRKNQHSENLTSILKKHFLIKNQKIEISLIRDNLYKIILI